MCRAMATKRKPCINKWAKTGIAFRVVQRPIFKPMTYLFILLMGYYFSKKHYRFPRSTHLLDVTLHKDRGETIHPYIELLYELANHVDSFHSAGWIFRCLRAKNIWILHTKVSQMKKVKSDQ